MRRGTAVCLAALWASALGGCGTAGNLWRPPVLGGQHIYGGVRLDAAAIRESLTGQPPDPDPRRVAPPPVRTILCSAVDLPFSAVADTLTLPATIRATLDQRRDKQKPAPESADQAARATSTAQACRE